MGNLGKGVDCVSGCGGVLCGLDSSTLWCSEDKRQVGQEPLAKRAPPSALTFTLSFLLVCYLNP